MGHAGGTRICPRVVNGLAHAIFAVGHEVPVGGQYERGVVVPEPFRDGHDGLTGGQQDSLFAIIILRNNGE